MSNKHIGLSLFSGAGGLDLGLKQAGFGIAACLEADPHCCSTLRSAAEREGIATQVLEGDIRQVDPAVLRRQLGLKKGQLHLLFGGPPCQSFSQIGKQHGLADPRGLLLFEMARFANEFKPKVILLEQVRGLLSGKGPSGRPGEIFEQFLESLCQAGYVPKWKVMLAADFGVPQLRERVFVVATHGRNGFVYPDPTHAPPEECEGLFRRAPHKTVGEALAGLDAPYRKQPKQTEFPRRDSHVDVTPVRDQARIHPVPEGSYLAAQTHVSEELRRGLMPKDTTKYLRLHRKRPANTLRCGEIFYHPVEDRYLTPREYMRIHGYPDTYELKGPIRSRTGTVRNLDQHRQVANSVPPPLAQVLGERILEYFDATHKK